MPNIPSLNIPFLPTRHSSRSACFLLCSGLSLIVYFALHGLLATRFGRVLIAIRENEQRVELGYDARLHKLVAFAIGGALAGLAGCLYVAWGNRCEPAGLQCRPIGEIIIWLMVGGRRHPAWSGARRHGDLVADGQDRHSASRQCQCHPWRGFTRLRPVGAEGRRTNGERLTWSPGCSACGGHPRQRTRLRRRAKHEPAADRNAQPEQTLPGGVQAVPQHSTSRSPKANCVV